MTPPPALCGTCGHAYHWPEACGACTPDYPKACAPPAHRCSGCGHRWSGQLNGAELCGDCWRAAQPVVHGKAAGA